MQETNDYFYLLFLGIMFCPSMQELAIRDSYYHTKYALLEV